jgi:hypothetical protein
MYWHGANTCSIRLLSAANTGAAAMASNGGKKYFFMTNIPRINFSPSTRDAAEVM